MSLPDDLVLVGHISGAYGIRGWIRITPYSGDADALLHAKTWWLDKPEMHDVEMLQAKIHSGEVVAHLMGVEDRTQAEALKGTQVQISRRHFPPLAEGEFYWIDLIGSTVENLEGETLGTVSGMMDNGAHPILRVEVPAAVDAKDEKPAELLIPFVEHFVKDVDQANKKLKVDWERDY
jgi:16S rRNA processing protein RimM